MPLKQLSLIKLTLSGAFAGIIFSLVEFYYINPTTYYPRAYIIYISSLYLLAGILTGIIGYSKLKAAQLLTKKDFPFTSPSIFLFSEVSSIFIISVIAKIYTYAGGETFSSLIIFWIKIVLLIYLLSFIIYIILTFAGKSISSFSSLNNPLYLFLLIVFLCGAIALYSFYPAASTGIDGKVAGDSSKPSVIAIVIDTLRYDYVTGYGGVQATSKIEEMAKDSIVYENCFSSSPWTVPSHSTLFTSLPPSSHGAMWIDEGEGNDSVCMPLAEDSKTLAEVLSDEGYETTAFIGNMNLSKAFGLSQGFDIYNDNPHPYFEGFILRPSLLMLLYDNIRFPPLRRFVEKCDLYLIKAVNIIYGEGFRNFPLNYPNILRRTKKRADEVNYEFFRWLEKRGNTPFFAFINYYEPHDPYLPPEKFVPEEAKKYDGKIDKLTYPTGYACKVLKGEDVLSEDDIGYIKSLYEGEVRFVDYNIGLLIDLLKEKGIYDNSVIIITSDHGEALGDHNFLTHDNYLYDELIHVPLIVKLPKNKNAGLRKKEITGLIDIAPSLLKFFGMGIPEEMQGNRDIFEFDESNNGFDRFIFSEVNRTKKFINCSSNFDRDLKSVRNGKWKAILSSKGSFELYDIISDPLESDNLEESEPARGEEYKTKLNDYFKNADRDKGKKIPMHKKKEVIDRLRALGYLQ